MVLILFVVIHPHSVWNTAVVIFKHHFPHHDQIVELLRHNVRRGDENFDHFGHVQLQRFRRVEIRMNRGDESESNFEEILKKIEILYKFFF